MCAVPLQDIPIQLEAEEVQSGLGDESSDLIECQSMLLHMEKQVTAFTGRIEVLCVRQTMQLDARTRGKDITAEAADVIGRAGITARGNELTQLDQMGGCNRTVE